MNRVIAALRRQIADIVIAVSVEHSLCCHYSEMSFIMTGWLFLRHLFYLGAVLDDKAV